MIVEEQEVRRGEIYHADLNPVFGSEQGGYRPVLIIQNNRGNRHSPTVIVAAITSRPKTKLPTHVPINGIKGLEKESFVLLEQIRTLDKGRLDDFVGRLNREQMIKVDKALRTSMEIKKLDKPILDFNVLMPGVCKAILQFKGTLYHSGRSGTDNKGNVYVL